MASSAPSIKRANIAIRGADGPCQDGLLRVVDACLAGVLLVAPLFMGGRHPLGELVFVTLVVVAATAWLARQSLRREASQWTWSGAEWILFLGTALLVLQVMPLPAPIVRVLSPHSREMLPLWNAGSGALDLGSWSQISLAPTASRGSLAIYLAYVLLFGVTLARVRRLEDVERLLGGVALAAVVLASIGLLQYLAGNGRFVWIYEHPFRDTNDAVMGPLINKNHFAHLLALGLAPLIWTVERALASQTPRGRDGFVRPRSAYEQLFVLAAIVGLGLVLFAGLMTLSRGGAAAMFAAASIVIVAFLRRGLLGARFAAVTAGVFALIFAALVIHGFQQVSDRFDDYASGSLDQLDQKADRRAIWTADSRAVRDFWPCGTGAGTHREAYPMYFTGSYDVEMTHAENGYLQVAMETGLPGLVLLLLGLVICGRWCSAALKGAKSSRSFACAAVISAGLAASALHSMIDFVWYIPACMSFAVLLAACACRLAQLSGNLARRPASLSPAVYRVGFACVAGIGAWMVLQCFGAAMASPHWDNYLAYSQKRHSQPQAASDEAGFEHLTKVVHWTPGDARAHVRLAGVCLRRFDQLQKTSANAMALSQIRDAAIASQFSSRAALDAWLDRAVGKQKSFLDKALWHVHRSLELCPMQGEAYLYLAELCFLEGAGPEVKAALVAQGLRVRPNSPRVLLAAGNEAALASHMDEAVALWRRAFHGGAEERRQLVGVLVANRVPADFAIENFQPDLAGFRELYGQYRTVAPAKALKTLAERYAEAAGAEAKTLVGEAAAARWLEARGLYAEQGDETRSQACLQAALAADASNYDAHYLLGMQLASEERFEESEPHLRWCKMRRPSDVLITRKLEDIAKARITR